MIKKKMYGNSHIFNRSGIASLSEIENSKWQEVFNELENEQRYFLSKEDQFRSSEYKWPHDPLHTWSRIWEYPYVYYHIKMWKKTPKDTQILRVVDFGCGVTFFPFSVARLGCNVKCIDNDITCEKDLQRAMKYMQTSPGTVDFQLADDTTLPLSNDDVDVVYSVSVLEHIPNFEESIKEIARILKPGGLLVLTIDLDLRGDSEIGVDGQKKMTEILCKHFDYLYPETVVHPADMLHSESGPYGYKKITGLKLLWFIIKQYIIKPVLGKRPNSITSPFHLAVQGFVMTKKTVV